MTIDMPVDKPWADYTPELRGEHYKTIFDTQLRILEMQTGFSQGTFNICLLYTSFRRRIMDTLTFEGNFCDIAMCREIPGGSFCEDGYCSQRKVWERLKAYEDTGLELSLIHILTPIN